MIKNNHNSFIVFSDKQVQAKNQQSQPISIQNPNSRDESLIESNSPNLSLSLDEDSKLDQFEDSRNPNSKESNKKKDEKVLSVKIASFFSDGELTPELTSPAVSRPPTPKSDTELEMHKTKRQSLNGDTSNQWSWTWGQLPERQNNRNQSKLESIYNEDNDKNDNLTQIGLKEKEQSTSRLLGGMLNLIGSNNSISNNINLPVNDNNSLNNKVGIYLDDTEKLDSEIAALYLDQKSINSYKPTGQKCSSKDEDQESHSLSPKDYYSILGDVQISLCGFISNFENNANTTSKLSTSPSNSVINEIKSTNNNLSHELKLFTPLNVEDQSSVKLTNSNNDLNSNTNNHEKNIHKISSQTLNIDLKDNSSADSSMMSNINFDELFQQYSVSFEKFIEEITTITNNPNLIFKINNRYMNWSTASPIIISAIVYHKQLPNDFINLIY